MTEVQTLTLSNNAHDHAKKRALGLLKLSVYDGMKIPFTQEEEMLWRDFIGTYTALYDLLAKGKDQDGQMVASMYALNSAATYIIDTRGLAVEHSPKTAVQFTGVRTEERIRALFKDSLETYLSLEQNERQASIGGVMDYFARQANTAATPYTSIARQYLKTQIQIRGKVYSTFLQQYDNTAPKLALEDRIVGNEKMMEGLSCALHALAHFDGTRNPLLNYMKIPKTINIHGPPGCGKTMGIRQAYIDAKQLYERQMSVPFEMISLSNKFKSSLFSESSERLRALFKKANSGEAAYVIVADDIESIFHNRRHLDNNPEEKNIMNTLLNELEGLLSNDTGSYLFIATSNFPLQIDPALDQRLSELVLQANGPKTPNEYATLFRQKFAKGIDVGYVRVDNWQSIGELAAEIRFPGRHAKTLSGRHVKDIVATLNATKVLPIMPKKTLLTRKQVEKALARPLITQQTILTAITDFATAHEAYLDDILAV